MEFKTAQGLANRLLKSINKPPGSTVHIVGSIRRYSAAIKKGIIDIKDIPKIKDIDILVIVKDQAQLCKPITFKNYGTPKITPRKRQLKLKGVNVDVFLATKQEKHFAMLHFTSSKQFLMRTRAHAKKLGYKLNQYGLFNAKTLREVKFVHKSDLDVLSKINVSRHAIWDRFV